LEDINSRSNLKYFNIPSKNIIIIYRIGYEASNRIFVIRSVNDQIVGNIACDGQLVSIIPGQHNEIVVG
jgi:hypothetical protein